METPEEARAPRAPGLSITLICRDEAERIGETIAAAAALTDDFIVLDSGSTDGTLEVARAAGVAPRQAEWRGYGPQKRAAEDLCRHDWILNIDADERLSPELADEIAALFADGPPGADAYRIPIRDRFPFETRPAPRAFTYNQIRLYDRRRARFSPSTVHDSVLPEKSARIGQLEGLVFHDSFRSLAETVAKLNRYSTMQEEERRARGRRFPRWRLVTEFPLAFLKALIVRGYWRYGLWGVSLAVLYAFGRHLRIAKWHETEKLARAAGGADRRR